MSTKAVTPALSASKPIGKPPAPAGETTPQKLQRLGNPRVAKALQAIRVVGNCAVYNPTPSQTDKVFAALSAELQRAHAAWKEQKKAAPVIEGLL